MPFTADTEQIMTFTADMEEFEGDCARVILFLCQLKNDLIDIYKKIK
jgi:hypothetical protein